MAPQWIIVAVVVLALMGAAYVWSNETPEE